LFSRLAWLVPALALCACGVPQGGVCQWQPAPNQDCQSGLVCCADPPVLGQRGTCQAVCTAVTRDAGQFDAGPVDSGPNDAGSDAGEDGGSDSGSDAGEDAGMLAEDAGTDAGP
jgi:hypothetical protein